MLELIGVGITNRHVGRLDRLWVQVDVRGRTPRLRRAALASMVKGGEALLGGVRGFRLTPQLSRGTTDLSATIELVHASFSVPSKEEIAAMALAQQGAGQ